MQLANSKLAVCHGILIPADPSLPNLQAPCAGVWMALSGWQPWPGYGSLSAMMHAPNPYRGFRYPAEVIQHAV